MPPRTSARPDPPLPTRHGHSHGADPSVTTPARTRARWPPGKAVVVCAAVNPSIRIVEVRFDAARNLRTVAQSSRTAANLNADRYRLIMDRCQHDHGHRHVIADHTRSGT